MGEDLRVWPHAIDTSSISSATEVACEIERSAPSLLAKLKRAQLTKGPHRRPVSLRSRLTRKTHAELDVASLKAELVPGLQHARPKVEVVARFFGERDDETAVLGGNGVRIIPLKIGGGPKCRENETARTSSQRRNERRRRLLAAHQ